MRWLLILILAFATHMAVAQDASQNIRTAVFAGGCFWCMEPPFDKLPGVQKTLSGYIGGSVENPTYKQVSAGNTGHAEALQVTYDADKVSYAELLKVFWRNIDPLDAGGQFCDRGNQYRSEIFYGNEKEKALALASRIELTKMFDKPIATKITPATTFYPAEQYHQNYYQRNPVRYKFYRYSCGRDKRLESVWSGAQ